MQDLGGCWQGNYSAISLIEVAHSWCMMELIKGAVR